MDILIKITLTQLILLVIIHFSLHPYSPLADKIEKYFGDYEKGLSIIAGVQFLGLFITAIVAIWTRL